MANVTSLASRRQGPAHTNATASPSVPRIYLIGGMRALDAAGGDILSRAKKAQAVLAYLCLAQGERVLRSRLAGLIWDRAGEVQARDSLRHALRELERTGSWRFYGDRDAIRFDTTACWIDAFENPEGSGLLLDGLHDVSPGFDQWLLAERARFENRWQGQLEMELDQLVADKASPELRAAAARKLLNFIPTHETAIRCLMSALAAMGEGAQAVREFERFQQIVNTNLGMPPSRPTAALHSAIRLASQIRPAGRSDMPEAPARSQPPLAGDHSQLERTGVVRDGEPSIAVLPFRDLSDKAGRDYVVKGLVEDLIEALSRIPTLFVVSRLSAAALGSQNRSPREIGEALGVRYILSGSMRAVRDRLRITIELTDTNSGRALWNSRFDEDFSDLLQVQDRLTDTVVRSVAPNLRAAELHRGRTKRPECRDAYDLLLFAQEHMHNPSRAVFEAAETVFDQAIAREPDYAAALAWRAYWHVMRVGQGWSPDPAQDATEADRFARLATECDPSEPMAFAVQGHVASFLHKDFDRAFSAFETALRLNPNFARAWLWNANTHGYMGDGAPAVEKVNRAMALFPYDPLVCAFSSGASLAYLADSQYDRAIEFALRCIRQNRGYSAAYRLLIVALVLAGRREEAHSFVERLLVLEPGFTVQENRRRFPGSAWPFGEMYSDALARAGVPLSG